MREIRSLRTKTSRTYDLGGGKRRIVIDPTWQVGASSDDCSRYLTPDYFSLTSSYVEVGWFRLAQHQMGSGMRFTDITVPKEAIINSAYLTLRCAVAESATEVNSKISAEDVDDAPTFADDSAAFDTRFANHTTARVDWDNIPAWTKDVDYNSPEIKTVIQEVVDRGGWASGHAMVIFWEDYDDRSSQVNNAQRLAYSYNGSTTYAPKLIIDYTPPVVAGRSFGFIFG